MNQNECFVHQSGTPTTFSRLAGWKGAKGMTFSQHNAKSKMSLKNCYPSSKCVPGWTRAQGKKCTWHFQKNNAGATSNNPSMKATLLEIEFPENWRGECLGFGPVNQHRIPHIKRDNDKLVHSSEDGLG